MWASSFLQTKLPNRNHRRRVCDRGQRRAHAEQSRRGVDCKWENFSFFVILIKTVFFLLWCSSEMICSWKSLHLFDTDVPLFMKRGPIKTLHTSVKSPSCSRDDEWLKFFLCLCVISGGGWWWWWGQHDWFGGSEVTDHSHCEFTRKYADLMALCLVFLMSATRPAVCFPTGSWALLKTWWNPGVDSRRSRVEPGGGESPASAQSHHQDWQQGALSFTAGSDPTSVSAASPVFVFVGSKGSHEDFSSPELSDDVAFNKI